MTPRQRVKAFRAGKLEIKDGIVLYENGEKSSLPKDIHENIHEFDGLGKLYYETTVDSWVVNREDMKNFYLVPLIEESYPDGPSWWEFLAYPYRGYLYEKGMEDGKDMITLPELVEMTKHKRGFQFDIGGGEVELYSLRPFELGNEDPEFFINSSYGDKQFVVPMKEVLSAEVTHDAIIVKHYSEEFEEVREFEVGITVTMTVNPRTRE